jgi:mRNA interferase RelE/StbE
LVAGRHRYPGKALSDNAGQQYRIMRFLRFMGQVLFTPNATKQLFKLSPQIRERISKKLDVFAATGQGDVKKLKGQAGARLRIGDWRVYYEEAGAIVVAAVGHRRNLRLRGQDEGKIQGDA